MKMFGICALLALAATAAESAPIELSTPERAAAFQAAGFRHWPEGWARCREDSSASHTYGVLKIVDLNGDGAPEVWITERGASCYGDPAQATVLLTRKPSGWVVLLDEVGVALEHKTRSNGWPDIEVGGPGHGPSAVLGFNGTKYVTKR